MRLNITSGDKFNEYIKTQINDNFIPFREAMIDGISSEDVFSSNFNLIRSKNHRMSLDNYKEHMHLFYNAIKHIESYDEIVLWFGNDTFCQINFLAILAYFSKIQYKGSIYKITIDDQTNEIIKDKELIKRDDYYNKYCSLLCFNKPTQFNDFYLNKASNDYLDLLNKNGNIAKLIQNNEELLTKKELIELIWDKTRYLGLGDIQVLKLINKFSKKDVNKEIEMKPSKIIQGLMRIENLNDDELYNLIVFDLENGINFFDISDIYGNGECEIKLGNVLKNHPELRQKMIIQSKCGIVKSASTYYDLSYEHIIQSLDKSLKRMNIKYLDYYLLHRPDIFSDNQEINKAYNEMISKGLIKHFGVSNSSIEFIKYLTKNTNTKVEVNQLQLGLGHLNLVSEPLNFNVDNDLSFSKTTDSFFYLKRKNISLQCWSPYQYGFFKGSIFKSQIYENCNEFLDELAKKYNTSKCAIATSFLLKLGDNVQVITGAIDTKYIKESIDGTLINLTKEEWYKLYKSTNAVLP